MAGLFLLLLAAGILSSQRMLFGQHWPLKWIEVHGEFERVSAEQVRATAAPLLEEGFFGVDLPLVRTRIEALSWVRIAEVRKRWPDRVEIYILEHEPSARWGDSQLVSKLGEVFTAESGVKIEGLPVLNGPADAAPEMMAFYGQVQNHLLGTGMDVRQLFLSQRGAWRATLSGGLEIELGRDEPLRRLSRLISALDDLHAEPGRQLARVDLRYTNGFAVHWRSIDPPQVLAAISKGGVSGSTQ
jgi:cell division protein FtsQ